ncbi:eIF2 kinase Gcn2p negative regulator [Monascus purpureus]|uniref:eIF2 kinase Gcn2p negative regulator n=1 Tax=Monascus purpureus TaxID=5098 RepID=A0A507QQA4_MONPU|nr:eIF2 kinase Gcn2p negative regulator [Monascus purpureus]BDD61352.1 hypothetical protein MAP00_006399 [Monascus purpureus]
MSELLDSVHNEELADEIAAINAIYGPDTLTVTATKGSGTASTEAPYTLDLGSSRALDTLATTATLQIPNHPHLSFVVGFDPAYPDTPPRIVGTASTSSRGEGKIAVEVLEDIIGRIHQPGLVCLFEVISDAAEAFEELSIGGKNDSSDKNDNGGDEEVAATDSVELPTESFAALSLRDTFGLDAPPDWILSDVVTEKKSVFVGRAASVSSVEQAQAFIDYLLSTDKKVAAATHNITSWRIRQKKRPGDSEKGESASEIIFEDCDDDGESAAGGRLLHLMQLMDVWNVVLVVTRWYGGIHLGPDRFRIINAVGRDALVKGRFNQEGSAESNQGNEKGKKKGKK